MMSFDEFLSRLDGVRQSGDGYIARCPAHDDRRQSLSVRRGHKVAILVKCFSGCTFDQIMAAVYTPGVGRG